MNGFFNIRNSMLATHILCFKTVCCPHVNAMEYLM